MMETCRPYRRALAFLLLVACQRATSEGTSDTGMNTDESTSESDATEGSGLDSDATVSDDTWSSGGETATDTEPLDPSFDYAALRNKRWPPCIRQGETAIDYVTPAESELWSCRILTGTNAGRPPAGVSVDADTCTITGDAEEQAWGALAWMVELSSGDRSFYVPYCYIQRDGLPRDHYRMAILVDGAVSDARMPMVIDYIRYDPIVLGDDDGGSGSRRFDPSIVIENHDCISDEVSCSLNTTHTATDSTFGTLVSLKEPLYVGGELYGLAHGIVGKSPVRDGSPWVVVTHHRYCIEPKVGTVDICADIDNGRGDYVLSFIMWPSGI